jgi:hypothetical protein
MTPLETMRNIRRDRIGQRESKTFVSAWFGTSISQYGAVPDADNDSMLGQIRELHEEKYRTSDSRVPGGVIRRGHTTHLGRFVYGQPLPSLMMWGGNVGTISTIHGRGRQATYQGQGQKRDRKVTGATAAYFMNRTAKDTDSYKWYIETRNPDTGAVLTTTQVGSYGGLTGSAGKWRKHWFTNLDPNKEVWLVVEWTKGYNQVFDGGDIVRGTEKHGLRFINLHKSGSKTPDYMGVQEVDGISTNFSNLHMMSDDEVSGPDEYCFLFGTNEQGSATFYDDLMQMIKWARKINDSCLIWLMLEGLPGACDPEVWLEMLAKQFDVAHDMKNVGVLPFTDLYTKGGIPNWTPGSNPEFMYGPLHPNRDGYAKYAAVAFNNLTGASVPVVTDPGTTPPGDGSVDSTGPTIQIISPADGITVKPGDTVDFVFKVTDPSGIGASRGVFSQPGGALLGVGTPNQLTDLGTDYYGYRGITYARLKELNATRWSAAFRDASPQSNRAETAARSLTLAADTTAPVNNPAPTASGLTPGALFQIANGATVQRIEITLTHPLGMSSASVYAAGSGQSLLIGPMTRVGTSDVWRLDADVNKLKTSNRFSVVYSANKLDAATPAQTGRTSEVPFTFAAGLDVDAPTITILGPIAGTIVGENVEFSARIVDAGSGVAVTTELGTSGVSIVRRSTMTVLLDLSLDSGTVNDGIWKASIPRDDLKEANPGGGDLAFTAMDVAGNRRTTSEFGIGYPVLTTNQMIIPGIFRETGIFKDPMLEAAFQKRLAAVLAEQGAATGWVVLPSGTTAAPLLQKSPSIAVVRK